MKLKLNGIDQEVNSATIAELLIELDTPAKGVAIALNDHVVPRAEHGSTQLQEGDTVELVVAVQGG